jgi:hypothetical protein
MVGELMFNLTAFICDIQGRADWGVGVTPPPPRSEKSRKVYNFSRGAPKCWNCGTC